MKNLFKYITKLLFVIIIPILTIVLTTIMINEMESDKMLIVILVMLSCMSLLNALMFNKYITSVGLFPIIDCEFGKIIGFAIMHEYKTFSVVIPFVVINLRLNVKKKFIVNNIL
tara:strand:- start:4460 stop:4801 length:342 start_codon:yes stop_codon:yes gene_type:complete